ncbi:MAG: hypothetical protein MRZ79_25545 [Bacteroidia bacterium]|nr:hypothetical protein [Bacteroidia bacterium]
MKKIIFTLALVCITAGLQAQIVSNLFSSWKLKSFGLSAGVEQDMIMNFSGNSFVRMSGYDDLFTSRDIDLDQLDLTAGICENPHLRAQAIFSPAAMPNLEIHTAMVAIINRVDAITYWSDTDLGRYDNSLTLDSWGSEVAAEMAFIRRLKAGPFSLYGGLGTNLGFTFANTMSIYGTQAIDANDLSFAETGVARFDANNGEEYTYFSDYNDISNGISQRVFAQGGASITFLRRLELGLEGRYGFGYRYHFGGKNLTTNLNSFAIFTRWNLN